jgi:sorting nexin-8
MSLFGSTPPDSEPAKAATPIRSRSGGLFDDDDDSHSRQHTKKASSNSLFADDDAGNDSPWDMPTPRKQQSRADMIRNLLPAGDVPDSYIETFDTVVRLDGGSGRVGSSGVAKLFASANVGSESESRIKSIIKTIGDDVSLGRGEFNVLLALVGLAQEGEVVSLDGVDERRRSKLTILPSDAPLFPLCPSNTQFIPREQLARLPSLQRAACHPSHSRQAAPRLL